MCPFVLKESHTLDNILSTYAGKWLLLSYILEEKTIIFNATFFYSQCDKGKCAKYFLLVGRGPWFDSCLAVRHLCARVVAMPLHLNGPIFALE